MNDGIGIVWNPSKVDDEELRGAFAGALEEAYGPSGRPEVHWFETTEDDPGQGPTAEALAAGCGLVIAAGGDGTVRSVCAALGSAGSSDADLGVVPLGTGNLLARNLGVPLGNARTAFDRALRGKAAPLDLGEVRLTLADGREEVHGFVVMIGFGIDAQMIAETDDELKARAGWLAYVESLGRAAAGTEVVDFSLALDAEPARAERAHTMIVANCGGLQGGITLLPDALPDDGALDLLVLRADDVAAWLDTMRNMMWQNGLKRLVTGRTEAESSDSTTHLRASRVRVELPAPLAFEVDGDDVGEVTAFEARILPSALRVRGEPLHSRVAG